MDTDTPVTLDREEYMALLAVVDAARLYRDQQSEMYRDGLDAAFAALKENNPNK